MIFDRFFQINNSSTREHEGTGIGLALSKQLAELHGGTLVAKSEPNQETTFTVTLYLKNEESENLQLSSNQTQIPLLIKGDSISIENPAILNEELPIALIVEDNSGLRDFIKSSLTDQFRIYEAVNGLEGIEMAKELIPDIIISDIMMPKADGIELCQTLKNDDATSHIPIILLTAKAGEEQKLEGLKIGADDYLTKPFSLNELRVRSENLVNIRKVLREKLKSSLLTKVEETELDSKDKKFLNKVIDIINENLTSENFGVESLASKIGLSTSQLNRKINAITGESPVKFIRNIRLKKAFDMLKADTNNISEIAYSTGFDSPGYFTKVFKKHFGFLPSEKDKFKNIT